MNCRRRRWSLPVGVATGVLLLLLVPGLGTGISLGSASNLSPRTDSPTHLLKTITLRCGAASAAVNPGRDLVYAAGFGCISVINGATNLVAKTLHFDGTVTAVVFDPVHGSLWVALDTHPYKLEVLDASTYRVISTLVLGGYPTAALCAQGRVYVTYARGPGVLEGIGHVAVYNTTTLGLIARVAVGSYPGAPAYDAQTKHVYVANATTIFVIRTSDDRVTSTFTTGSGTAWMFFDPRNGNLYLAHYDGSTVSVVDAANQKRVATISVGASPRGLAFDPVNNRLYAANAGTNDVSVIDLFTESVVRTVPVGFGPDGEVFDPVNQDTYVTNAGTDTVSVLAA
jgi:YVTN family beta-propeller protein